MHACPQCRRHIRESECPFCHAAAPAPPQPTASPISRIGLTRGALVASMLAATACSGAVYGIADTGPNDTGTAVDAADGAVAAYGIPIDAAQEASSADVAPDSPVAAYGIPIDAGQDGLPADVTPADTTPADSAPDGPVAAYGIPPQDGG